MCGSGKSFFRSISNHKGQDLMSKSEINIVEYVEDFSLFSIKEVLKNQATDDKSWV